MKKHTKITAKELEERFDNDENVLQFFDTTKAELQEPKTQRVNVDFPEWIEPHYGTRVKVWLWYDRVI